ncbi:group II intron reverse transcriptase/maturase [Paeniroseomonas aquatica]|uniref:Group II intron reverse transcriptase/maturase n=1 Tax=Paeniroseomonas aquatica TaxID=373043 RepID=A0ABT8ACI3_9PROT|nr:group II intron reverse transcriptase/maturase [Paeniroseomonas aquatica]MDN3567456.1 group II intron reverse transcriptase/maturase [Paeniroseomonas aquatica]
MLMLPDTVQKRMDKIPALVLAGKRVNGLHRLLVSPALWRNAVERVRKNKGSSTPGIDNETFDGLTTATVSGWVDKLVERRYTAQPVKRVYIPKPNGKERPLGIPTISDRVLQDVQRVILEQIYEPVFSDRSHGFRPGRSCHTALEQLRYWAGTKWFVEVDIKGYFDNIDHDVLLELMRKRVDDEDFLKIIRKQLKAGVMEKRTLTPTYSGTPQGGIVSPILANVYLHELDMHMEALMAGFNRGKVRRATPLAKNLSELARHRRRKIDALGDDEASTVRKKQLLTEIEELIARRNAVPASDPHDPTFRRMQYMRYADDFLIGMVGTREEALATLENVRRFLKDTLHLDVAEDKTRVVPASEGVMFLGYTIKTKTGSRETKRVSGNATYKIRSPSDRITLSAPDSKLRAFCQRHRYGDYDTAIGKARPELLHSSDFEIAVIFNAELRGLANYYRLDKHVKRHLSKLHWVWQQSFARTLANKHQSTALQQLARFKVRPGVYIVTHSQGEGKDPLRVQLWNLFSGLRYVGRPATNRSVDEFPTERNFAYVRTDITTRLAAKQCESCGEAGEVEVHHVRKMADMAKAPFFKGLMASRTRKSAALCPTCHRKLHAGLL